MKSKILFIYAIIVTVLLLVFVLAYFSKEAPSVEKKNIVNNEDNCVSPLASKQNEIDSLNGQISVYKMQITDLESEKGCELKTNCYDTDSKDDPYIKGVINLDEGVVKEDHCYDKMTLFEQNCEGGKRIPCEFSCSDGVCGRYGSFR